MEKALEKALAGFRDCLESELADDFLTILLDLLAAAILLSPKFRENVKDFRARYLFKTQDGSMAVTADFGHQMLIVRQHEMAEPKPDITILFKNAKALMGFLLARKPDVLGSMLRQEVRLEGNLNYLYKLAFMARHLQLAATHAL